MTDAYKCDRCGSFEAKPVALQVGAANDVAGRITATQRELSVPAQGASRNTSLGSVDDPRCTYDVNGGDLCEECADDFREFWEVDADA